MKPCLPGRLLETNGALAGRLTVLVGTAALLFAVVAAAVFLWTFRRAQTNASDGRLLATTSWLASGLELEQESRDGRITQILACEWKTAPDDPASYWSVTLADGTELQSTGPLPECHRLHTREISLGRPEWPPAKGHDITQRLVVPTDEDQDELQYFLAAPFRRVDLRLTAGESIKRVERPWRHALAYTLIGGGLALVLFVTALWLLLSRALTPLARMADEIAHVGPDRPELRLSAPHAGREMSTLHTAVNAMIDRQMEGLARERHFAGMAAHELRTPLHQIRMALDLCLRKERPADEYRVMLRETMGDVQRLQTLTGTLLTLARLSGEPARDVTAMSLSSMLADAAKRSPAAFVLPEPVPDNLVVLARDDLFRLAFDNLMDNAARHAPQTPPEVRARRIHGRVQLEISDRGPGVPEAERERIFEPLIQLNEARTIDDATTGFGLGLPMARAVMRAMGGVATCMARADGASGAVFVLSFATTEEGGD